MREQIIARFKELVRPIISQRFQWERLKYRGDQILDAQSGNDRLSQLIQHPGAAGKIGATEMKLCRRYIRGRNASDFCHDFGRHAWFAHVSSGIYPPNSSILSRFCREYLQTLRGLDLLAVWFNFGEAATRRKFAPKATICRIRGLEPFYHERPWSAQLAVKRVVVVSPFEKTIYSQYKRRKEVWAAKPDVLPEFDLRVVRCPQLAGLLNEYEYPDWFAGLEALKQQLETAPFDIAIVGAGAWSIPLVVHAKSLGAFGIHLGGARQLLFGIMGGRWESSPEINALRNVTWTRPNHEERPKEFRLQENGSYW
jgi:hypothetical protein